MDTEKIRLSLCMIVKDEAKNLTRCLKSVKDLVDEIIIVDTGSADATKEIARAYTDRIYDFVWKEDFSEARNYAASLARGEWILTMDADDELERQDKALLLQLLDSSEVEAYFFPTISFVGEAPGMDTVINMNLRLYRNNKAYKYTGRINEQLATNIIRLRPDAKLLSKNVRIYHYGYTLSEVKSKQKSIRNRRILELMLEENQEDPFALFNLGNQAFASNDYEAALRFYYSTLERIPSNSGYESKLLLRIVLCLIDLKDYKGGLDLIEEGLAKFPRQTDFLFLRGIILKTQQEYEAALRCFLKCLEIGEAPIQYRLVEGVGTYKSHYCLGDIYYEQKKYDLAFEAYAKAVAYSINYERALEKLIATAIELSDTKEAVAMVEAILEPLDVVKTYNLSKAYFKLKNYAVALHYIELSRKDSRCLSSIYLQGKIYFYTGSFRRAVAVFDEIKDNEDVGMEFFQLYLLSHLLLEDYKGLDRLLNRIKELDKDSFYYNTYSALIDLIQGVEPENFPSMGSSSAAEYINVIFQILKPLLEINALDLFEKGIGLLEYIKEPNALLRLGKLYYSFGYCTLAEGEIMRSIELYNICDDEGKRILKEIQKEN